MANRLVYKGSLSFYKKNFDIEITPALINPEYCVKVRAFYDGKGFCSKKYNPPIRVAFGLEEIKYMIKDRL